MSFSRTSCSSRSLRIENGWRTTSSRPYAARRLEVALDELALTRELLRVDADALHDRRVDALEHDARDDEETERRAGQQEAPRGAATRTG
jgi:hypothetical protein